MGDMAVENSFQMLSQRSPLQWRHIWMRGWWLQTSLAALVLLCPPCNAQQPQLAGIAHVAFRVSDLARSRGFFQKLGFEEAFVLTNGPAVTEVFEKVNDRQFIELYPRAGVAQALGWMHVCYESDALKELNALYAARGLNPSATVKAGAGNLIFSLKGPDGRTIEFTQYLPGSRHFNDRGKHLGAHRISQELQGIRVAADEPAAAKFYTQGLGFKPKGTGMHLRISRDGDQFIDLDSANSGDDPQFVFRVKSARQAARRLRSLGLDVTLRNGGAHVQDSDGNIFVFEAAASR
jgi:catechol 2,3-dioxygenase-like lactoylglutathione lyase family enzyme